MVCCYLPSPTSGTEPQRRTPETLQPAAKLGYRIISHPYFWGHLNFWFKLPIFPEILLRFLLGWCPLSNQASWARWTTWSAAWVLGSARRFVPSRLWSGLVAWGWDTRASMEIWWFHWDSMVISWWFLDLMVISWWFTDDFHSDLMDCSRLGLISTWGKVVFLKQSTWRFNQQI